MASFAIDAAAMVGGSGADVGNAAAALGATSTAAIGVLAAETIGVGAACIQDFIIFCTATGWPIWSQILGWVDLAWFCCLPNRLIPPHGLTGKNCQNW